MERPARPNGAARPEATLPHFAGTVVIRWLPLEALATLAWTRAVFAVLSFPRAMAGLRLRAQPASALASSDGPGLDPTLSAIRRAVDRASTVAPFRAVCLQQAIAAVLMLRRRGLRAEVHFGVARHDTVLSAHAWSVCQGHIVTGGHALDGVSRIAVFAAGPPGPPCR